MPREAVQRTPGIELLERRHALEILMNLAHRPLRYAELAQLQDGASRLVLTRLRELEAAGWLERYRDRGPPPAVRYRLTLAARGARPALALLRAICARITRPRR